MSTAHQWNEDFQNYFLNRAHLPAGPTYKEMCKIYASMCFSKNDDIKGIYLLSESHAPSYRIKTAYRYDKLVQGLKSNEQDASVIYQESNNTEFIIKELERLSFDNVNRPFLSSILSELDENSQNSISKPNHVDNQKNETLNKTLFEKSKENYPIFTINNQEIICEERNQETASQELEEIDQLKQSEQVLSMKKDYVQFSCWNGFNNNIKDMLTKIEELPEEWTIVQLTSQKSDKESSLFNAAKVFTDSLFITVFNCGKKNSKPFYIKIQSPHDEISGSRINLAEELDSIIVANKCLSFTYGSNNTLKNVTAKQKKKYAEGRNALNNRINILTAQIGSHWLKHWRCLFIGKFIDNASTNKIFNKIEDIFINFGYTLCDKMTYILQKIIAASEYLNGMEILNALKYFIHNDVLRSKVYKEIITISNSFVFKNMKRHPIILIVDEKLDCFPWEMLDVLKDHPVTRNPSLHFLYGLYKEHEHTIKNGCKEIDASNCSYIVNPGIDLPHMELRMKRFLNYWLPNCEGIIGKTPTSDQFSNLLTNKDIVIYCGHGSGTQFLSPNKIQQIRVNSVVLLFGCCSLQKTSLGSLVEMYDVFHNYLIACSPCVVGMLWEVTDFETDVLSTSLLSYWLPSAAKNHWKNINKSLWDTGKVTVSSSEKNTNKIDIDNEPELLRAIILAKKEPIHYLTKYAMIARGLPIKIRT